MIINQTDGAVPKMKNTGKIYSRTRVKHSLPEMKISKRPTLYEWKSANGTNVEFQFRTNNSGTPDQGFKMRLRCDRK